MRTINRLKNLSRCPTMVSIITALAMVFCAQIQAAEPTIYESAQAIEPLKIGDQTPTFTVQDVSGKDLVFDAGPLTKPSMFISFRGGWCPYCNYQLQDIRHVLPEISRDINVYFLSGDQPSALYSSLSDKTKEDIDGLDYVILSDANLQAASALGIAFFAPEKSLQRLKTKPSLNGSSSDQHKALAVPSIFIIDTDGKVAYAHSEADFRVRLSAAELLAAAQTVITQ